MLHGVQEQLSNRFEQERAHVLAIRVRERIGGDLNHDSVLFAGPFSEPDQGGRQSRTMQQRREELEAQRTGGSDGLIEVALRLRERLGRFGTPLSVALQQTIEIQRGTHQQLLETVVQRLREL